MILYLHFYFPPGENIQIKIKIKSVYNLFVPVVAESFAKFSCLKNVFKVKLGASLTTTQASNDRIKMIIANFKKGSYKVNLSVCFFLARLKTA